tara:strand:- start:542 stop:1054 length:513 start_codon:yes stop_codon:yes gene_type:complete
MEEVIRNYLEIKSLDKLLIKKKPDQKYNLEKVLKYDFQLNKFFYKQIGKNHHWKDRLIWSDNKWISYVSNPTVSTFILKENENLVGFFELIYHKKKFEIEIAYLGLLNEYLNRKLGGYLLSEAIKISFSYKNVSRVWVHTCSLDHKNALKNYLSRGMKVFNTEKVVAKIA